MIKNGGNQIKALTVLLNSLKCSAQQKFSVKIKTWEIMCAYKTHLLIVLLWAKH